MRRLLLLCSVVAILFSSCAGENLSNFQRNAADPDFTIFTLVEGYPSLEYLWDNMDSKTVNDHLSTTMKIRSDEFVRFSKVQADLIRSNPDILVSLVTRAGDAMETLLDEENKNYYSPFVSSFYGDVRGSVYQENFYALLDRIANAETNGLRPSVMNMIRTLLDYLVETKNPSDLNNFMYEAAAAMEDLERDDFIDLSKLLGKVLLAADYPIYLDGTGNLVASADEINIGSFNTDLGNMSRGLQSLLLGSAEMISIDPSLKNKMFDILREIPDLYAAETDGGKGLSDVMIDLVKNIETYFTPADTDEGETASTDYYLDTTEKYINSDLKNSLKELYPSLQKLMISSGKKGSIIADTNGKGDAPLEVIIQALKQLKGIGIDATQIDLAGEIYNMMRFDGNGRDRVTDPGASDMPYIDHLLFTLMASGSVGYLDGGNTGEDYDNFGHGHGTSTGGILTVNDSLYSMTSNAFCFMNTYGLCFDAPVGDQIWRCKDPFTAGTAAGKEFYLYPNYPANFLLSGNSIGDAGIPNGGFSLGNNVMGHWPYDSRGIGEGNTGRWVLGWVARVVWEGEGPYYSTQSAEVAGDVHTVYRPDGSIYAQVEKTDPGDASTWTYTYPKDADYDVDADSDGNRDNRYKETWKTDYFLIRNKKGVGTTYCHAPGSMEQANNSAAAAGAYTVTERIAEKNSSRECATQEEAMVRNFQWLVNEKKFLYVMPMRIDAGVDAATLYVRLEGNGIQGVANIRKAPTHGNWCSPTSDNAGDIPGAGRVLVEMSEGNLTNFSVVYDTVLGAGYVLPDIVGANFGPLQHMAIMNSSTVASADAGPAGPHWDDRSRMFPILAAIIGELHKRSHYEEPASGYSFNDSDNNRYPFKVVSDHLIPALAKPLFYYQKESGAEPHKAWKPQTMNNGTSCLQPDQDDPSTVSGDNGRTDSEFQPKPLRTLVSMLGESSPKSMDGLLCLMNNTDVVSKVIELLDALSSENFDNPAEFDSENVNTWGVRHKLFYGLEQLLTGMKVTAGEVYSRGYVSADDFEPWQLASGTEEPYGNVRECDVVLDSMFDNLLGPEGALSEIPDTLVSRENVIVKGRIVSMELPDESIVPGSVVLEFKDDAENYTAANASFGMSDGLITGSDIEGYGKIDYTDGRIYFVLKNEPDENLVISYSITENWDGFRETMDELGLFIEEDSRFNILDDGIDAFGALLDALTYDDDLAGELKGSLYVLGKLFAGYSGDSWTFQGEEGFDFLYMMLKEDLPKLQKGMLDENGDNIEAVLVLLKELLKENGMVESVIDIVDAMELTDLFEWNEIFGDLNALLHDDLMTDIDSDLWPALANMLEDMADAIESGSSSGSDAIEELFEEYGFQYNG